MPEVQPTNALARQLFEYLAEVYGDANVDLYASRVVAELFEISPIAREHLTQGRELSNEQREYLESSGQMGRVRSKLVEEEQKRQEQKAAKKGGR